MKFPTLSDRTLDLRDIIDFDLIATNRRLTFDIIHQHPETIYAGTDYGDYFKFTSKKGIEIMSRSRMDIQTERLWILGANGNDRSGSMVFSSNEKRDAALMAFVEAIVEWVAFVKGSNDNASNQKDFTPETNTSD